MKPNLPDGEKHTHTHPLDKILINISTRCAVTVPIRPIYNFNEHLYFDAIGADTIMCTPNYTRSQRVRVYVYYVPYIYQKYTRASVIAMTVSYPPPCRLSKLWRVDLQLTSR